MVLAAFMTCLLSENPLGPEKYVHTQENMLFADLSDLSDLSNIKIINF